MLAPSEKHLENWILAYPDTVIGDTETYKDLQQFQLPSGITDIIFYGGSIPIILVELKKGAINAAALTQTLRYLRDLKAISKLALDLFRHPLDHESCINDPEISAVLIGHTLEDRNLLISAELCNVQIMTYEYDSETNSYEFEEHDAPRMDLMEKYGYVDSQLGEAVQAAWLANYTERYNLNGKPTFSDVAKGLEVFVLQEKHGVIPFYEWMHENHPEAFEDNEDES